MNADHLHAQLLASAISTGAGPSALADLRAIVARTDEQIAALRKRKPRNMMLIAQLAERKRRCVRAVGEIEQTTTGRAV